MKNHQLQVCVLAFFVAGVCSAANWFVATTGSDTSNDGRTDQTPFATIQHAIDVASSGDVVLIADGVYSISTPLEIGEKDISLISVSGHPDAAVIDASGNCPCLSNEMGRIVLSGLGFRNGLSVAPGNVAGGIYSTGSDSVISNCVIRDCSHLVAGAAASGGGLYLASASVFDSVVSNCALSVTGADDQTALGGGIRLVGGRLQKVEVLECSVTNSYLTTGLAYDALRGGGICATGAAVISNSIIRGCALVDVSQSAKGVRGSGGGVYLSDYGTRLVDSSVSDCVSSSIGGGVCLGYKATVSACTVSGNHIKLVGTGGYNQLGGAGIGLIGQDTRVENCLIDSNVATNFNTVAIPGGAVNVIGGPATICGCVLRGNLAAIGAVMTASDGGAALIVVSNCVIVANECTKTDKGMFLIRGSSPLEMIDVLCVSNTAQVGFFFVDGMKKCGALTIRNSLFTGNQISQAQTGSTGWFVNYVAPSESYYSESQGVILDHCSILKNQYAYKYTKVPALFSLGGTVAANRKMSVTGCLIYGNSVLGSNPPFVFNSNCAGVTSVTYSYSDLTDDIFTVTPENHNLTDGALNFADEAKGDFRPLQGSCLIDAGGPKADWMGGRTRPDLGDGTYSISQVGKYGVSVSCNNVHRRYFGAASDIGCFEYWSQPGLMLLFR